MKTLMKMVSVWCWCLLCMTLGFSNTTEEKLELIEETNQQKIEETQTDVRFIAMPNNSKEVNLNNITIPEDHETLEEFRNSKIEEASYLNNAQNSTISQDDSQDDSQETLEKEALIQAKMLEIEQLKAALNNTDLNNSLHEQEKIDFYNAKNSGAIEIQTNVNVEDNINIDVGSDEYRVAKEASLQKINPDQVLYQEKIDFYANLKANPPQEDSYNPTRDCADTDDGAVDSYGDGCAGYTTSPSWCGGFDDDDFVSGDMCCACGGGADDGQGDVVQLQR